MKKLIVTMFIFGLTISALGQESASNDEDLRKVIDTFFEGFHNRDTVLMKSVVSDKVVMQSISKDPQGDVVLNQEDFGKFLRSIVAVPLNTEFREELHSYSIRRDGAMANVWTPYSLFVDDVLRHCGVNNFQLFKKDDKWQIIYLVDTRRKEGCDQKRLK